MFEGGELTIKDHLSFDFPPITSQEQWDEFLTTFWGDAAVFADLVANFSETKLNACFVD